MSRKSSYITQLLLFFCLSFFSCCNPSYLSVHTDYLSHRTLASYYVNTPDPLLDNPPIGQRLIVTWSIPKHIIPGNDLYLKIYLRYWNRQQDIKIEPVCKQRGTVVYTLMNEDYIATKGIMSYKVELIDNESIISEWKHQIWTDVIQVERQAEEAEPAEFTPDDELWD